MYPVLLLCTIFVFFFVLPAAGTQCLLGSNEKITLCAMCSDQRASVRWNRTREFNLFESMRFTYTCHTPENSTEIIESEKVPCDSAIYKSDVVGVVTTGVIISTGMFCDFKVRYRISLNGRGQQPKYFHANCTIKNPETCDAEPEQCRLDQVCEGNCGECYCSDGYSDKACTNINECNSNTTCHELAECSDTEGSYECTCNIGYEGDGSSYCIDINECELSNTTCHENAECNNSNGSYTCECKDGYIGDGYSNCSLEDINECELSNTTCHENAECNNSNGSYTCECKDGYIGDGYSNCSLEDINECELSNTTCHENAECNNSNGSYTCECKDGYIGDGYSNCSLEVLHFRPQDLPSSTYKILMGTVGASLFILLLLLLLLLMLLLFVHSHLNGPSKSFKLHKLPLDQMTNKKLDQSYIPNLSDWKESTTSLHSEYDYLNFITAESTKQMVNTEKNVMSIISSSKFDITESSGFISMPLEGNGYQLDDGTSCKEVELEQTSNINGDTFSVSDVIAVMDTLEEFPKGLEQTHPCIHESHNSSIPGNSSGTYLHSDVVAIPNWQQITVPHYIQSHNQSGTTSFCDTFLGEELSVVEPQIAAGLTEEHDMQCSGSYGYISEATAAQSGGQISI